MRLPKVEKGVRSSGSSGTRIPYWCWHGAGNLGSAGREPCTGTSRHHALLGQLWTMWLLAEVQHMRVLRMSHCFTLVSPPPFCTCRFVLCCSVVGVVLVCFLVFASARVVSVVFSSRVLDDRQCFTARSARHQKKKLEIFWTAA